jgi:hypothetical protein
MLDESPSSASPAPKRYAVGSVRKPSSSSSSSSAAAAAAAGGSHASAAFGYGFASPLRNFSSASPHLRKQRPVKVNDYVVPTSKKRDALRWSVRARMMQVS